MRRSITERQPCSRSHLNSLSRGWPDLDSLSLTGTANDQKPCAVGVSAGMFSRGPTNLITGVGVGLFVDPWVVV